MPKRFYITPAVRSVTCPGTQAVSDQLKVSKENIKCQLQGTNILLMVQKSGDHQLRLIVYPIIYRVSYAFLVVVWDFGTINSIPPNGSRSENHLSSKMPYVIPRRVQIAPWRVLDSDFGSFTCRLSKTRQNFKTLTLVV